MPIQYSKYYFHRVKEAFRDFLPDEDVGVWGLGILEETLVKNSSWTLMVRTRQMGSVQQRDLTGGKLAERLRPWTSEVESPGLSPDHVPTTLIIKCPTFSNDLHSPCLGFFIWKIRQNNSSHSPGLSWRQKGLNGCRARNAGPGTICAGWIMEIIIIRKYLLPRARSASKWL